MVKLRELINQLGANDSTIVLRTATGIQRAIKHRELGQDISDTPKKEKALYQELLTIMFDLMESRRDNSIVQTVVSSLALLVEHNSNKGFAHMLFSVGLGGGRSLISLLVVLRAVQYDTFIIPRLISVAELICRHEKKSLLMFRLEGGITRVYQILSAAGVSSSAKTVRSTLQFLSIYLRQSGANGIAAVVRQDGLVRWLLQYGLSLARRVPLCDSAVPTTSKTSSVESSISDFKKTPSSSSKSSGFGFMRDTKSSVRKTASRHPGQSSCQSQPVSQPALTQMYTQPTSDSSSFSKRSNPSTRSSTTSSTSENSNSSVIHGQPKSDMLSSPSDSSSPPQPQTISRAVLGKPADKEALDLLLAVFERLWTCKQGRTLDSLISLTITRASSVDLIRWVMSMLCLPARRVNVEITLVIRMLKLLTRIIQLSGNTGVKLVEHYGGGIVIVRAVASFGSPEAGMEPSLETAAKDTLWSLHTKQFGGVGSPGSPSTDFPFVTPAQCQVDLTPHLHLEELRTRVPHLFSGESSGIDTSSSTFFDRPIAGEGEFEAKPGNPPDSQFGSLGAYFKDIGSMHNARAQGRLPFLKLKDFCPELWEPTPHFERKSHMLSQAARNVPLRSVQNFVADGPPLSLVPPAWENSFKQQQTSTPATPGVAAVSPEPCFHPKPGQVLEDMLRSTQRHIDADIFPARLVYDRFTTPLPSTSSFNSFSVPNRILFPPSDPRSPTSTSTSCNTNNSTSDWKQAPFAKLIYKTKIVKASFDFPPPEERIEVESDQEQIKLPEEPEWLQKASQPPQAFGQRRRSSCASVSSTGDLGDLGTEEDDDSDSRLSSNPLTRSQSPTLSASPEAPPPSGKTKLGASPQVPPRHGGSGVAFDISWSGQNKKNGKRNKKKTAKENAFLKRMAARPRRRSDASDTDTAIEGIQGEVKVLNPEVKAEDELAEDETDPWSGVDVNIELSDSGGDNSPWDDLDDNAVPERTQTDAEGPLPLSEENPSWSAPLSAVEELRTALGHSPLRPIPPTPPLQFESRFECGNLHRAVQVGERAYDLVLNLDPNSQNRQWFYFKCSGMIPNVPYTFTIVNLIKESSSFQTGMVPVMYSHQHTKATQGKVGWHRASNISRVSYFHNFHRRENKETKASSIRKSTTKSKKVTKPIMRKQGKKKMVRVELPSTRRASGRGSGRGSRGGRGRGRGRSGVKKVSSAPLLSGAVGRVDAEVEVEECHYSMSITMTFDYAEDEVYLAHLYPFTYTHQRACLDALEKLPWARSVLRRQLLCISRGGNACEVLTVTDFAPTEESCTDSEREKQLAEIKARPVLVITARVHPGETGASWVMKGFLDFITSQLPDAVALRKRVVFKIVPILNPDGVIEGSYRASLSGTDLNRCWESPCPVMHPTLFWTKQLIFSLAKQRDTRFYVDLHGHSVMHSSCLYGCSIEKTDSGLVPKAPSVRARRYVHSFDHLIKRSRPPLDFSDEHIQKPSAPGRALQELISELTVNIQGPELYPQLLARHAGPIFSTDLCRFTVRKAKAGSARVVIWRELGLTSCFTLETTFCSADTGSFKDVLLQPRHYEALGCSMSSALWDWLLITETSRSQGTTSLISESKAPESESEQY